MKAEINQISIDRFYESTLLLLDNFTITHKKNELKMRHPYIGYNSEMSTEILLFTYDWFRSFSMLKNVSRLSLIGSEV